MNLETFGSYRKNKLSMVFWLKRVLRTLSLCAENVYKNVIMRANVSCKKTVIAYWETVFSIKK